MSAYTELTKYIGKKLTVTGADAGQCTAVCHKYTQLLNTPIIWGNAKDIYGNASDKYWQKIANTPSAIPKQGDIIIWGAMPGNPWGHVAVFAKGNVNNFTSIDQNWPLGSVAHYQYHANYANVIGWLRFRTSKPPAPKKATAAQINALYKQYLGRAADPGGLKTYSNYTPEQVKNYLLASNERKIYVANQQKAAAAAAAKAKADATAKAKALAQAQADAAAKAKQAEIEAQKAAEAETPNKTVTHPDLLQENNALLNKLVELVTQILNKLTGIFK